MNGVKVPKEVQTIKSPSQKLKNPSKKLNKSKSNEKLGEKRKEKGKEGEKRDLGSEARNGDTGDAQDSSNLPTQPQKKEQGNGDIGDAQDSPNPQSFCGMKKEERDIGDAQDSRTYQIPSTSTTNSLEFHPQS